uniref:Uncharacterized protein n=1 Tax=Tanacetum cinerariifolium TaxID=118510 RepID=A0A6L2JUU1_TANCI|nr:hypothetical protein [Tanacetum cinerariifolium]
MGGSYRIRLVFQQMSRGQTDHHSVCYCVLLGMHPFGYQRHGSWYFVEKRSRCKNNFSIVNVKGLLGWHMNWVYVNVDEDILSLQLVRWSNNVNRDSEDPLPIPPGLELDLYNLLHYFTIFGRQTLEDILSMLVASDDGGVLEHSKSVIPFTSLNVVKRLVPPLFVPRGDVPPGDHEIEDVDDKVPMDDCLTRKRTHYDDAGKTIDVVVDVASGSRSSKNKKTKKIVSDAFGASWSWVKAGDQSGLRDQVMQGVPLGRQGGGSRVFSSASKGDVPVTPEDHALLFQTGLRASDDYTMVGCAMTYLYLVDIVHEYDYLRTSEAEVAQRHNEEVAGLRRRIAKRGGEIKHANDNLADFVRVQKRAMYLGAHNLYVNIHEKFFEVPEADLKLDGNVAVKVVDEVAVLSMQSGGWQKNDVELRFPTDHVFLDEYMGVWFRSEVSEALEVRSMGISFRTELQEKITSHRLVIEHLEKVGATSG